MSTRILIVDDSVVAREWIRRVLESAPGFEICGEAENGREGVEKALQLHPNLIILDLAMPVMNGFDAARMLQQLMPTTPMIMLSMYSDRHVEREAAAAGIAAVLSKSDAEQTLVRRATELASQSGLSE
jgi:two-component system chemotaxis response regulator CheY